MRLRARETARDPGKDQPGQRGPGRPPADLSHNLSRGCHQRHALTGCGLRQSATEEAVGAGGRRQQGRRGGFPARTLPKRKFLYTQAELQCEEDDAGKGISSNIDEKPLQAGLCYTPAHEFRFEFLRDGP